MRCCSSRPRSDFQADRGDVGRGPNGTPRTLAVTCQSAAASLLLGLAHADLTKPALHAATLHQEARGSTTEPLWSPLWPRPPHHKVSACAL